jgi:hypothetical protein
MAIVNRRRLALIIAVLGMGGATGAFAQAANPFAQLAGSWRGSGVVRLADGRNERLSCVGTYAQKAGGSGLSLSIRCESENNNIDMRSSLIYENGGVAGHWQERNFGLEGDVNGSAAATSLRLQISGQLQGSMAVSVSGSSHQVNVTTAGPGFKSVLITFSRG